MGSSTKSGTPLETRGAARGIGNTIEGLFQGGDIGQVLSAIASPLQRLGSESSMNMLGLDPASIGLGSAVTRGLTDPRDATKGLFAALAPLEARQRSEGLSSLAGMFGGAGGRFGGSAAMGGGSFLADLAAQQMAGREKSLLDAQSVQNQLIGHLIPGLNQSAAIGMGATSDILGSLLGYAAPGAPVIQQSPWASLAGGLLGTGLGAFTGGLGAAGAGALGRRWGWE